MLNRSKPFAARTAARRQALLCPAHSWVATSDRSVSKKYELRGSPRRLSMHLRRPSDRTKLRKGGALGPQDLLTITLYRVTRKTNTDENGRLRHDECD